MVCRSGALMKAAFYVSRRVRARMPVSARAFAFAALVVLLAPIPPAFAASRTSRPA